MIALGKSTFINEISINGGTIIGELPRLPVLLSILPDGGLPCCITITCITITYSTIIYLLYLYIYYI